MFDGPGAAPPKIKPAVSNPEPPCVYLAVPMLFTVVQAVPLYSSTELKDGPLPAATPAVNVPKPIVFALAVFTFPPAVQADPSYSSVADGTAGD